jgi:hypothetical protein
VTCDVRGAETEEASSDAQSTDRRRVRRLALAGSRALVASAVLANSALAAPTGTITIGRRISTGQLTAQFSTTSDFVYRESDFER